MAKRTYDLKLHYGGTTKIIVEDKKLVYVPITMDWLWDENVPTEEFHTILTAMDIDPKNKSRAKNTRKKLRDLIMKKQK